MDRPNFRNSIKTKLLGVFILLFFNTLQSLSVNIIMWSNCWPSKNWSQRPSGAFPSNISIPSAGQPFTLVWVMICWGQRIGIRARPQKLPSPCLPNPSLVASVPSTNSSLNLNCEVPAWQQIMNCAPRIYCWHWRAEAGQLNIYELKI